MTEILKGLLLLLLLLGWRSMASFISLFTPKRSSGGHQISLSKPAKSVRKTLEREKNDDVPLSLSLSLFLSGFAVVALFGEQERTDWTREEG